METLGPTEFQLYLHTTFKNHLKYKFVLQSYKCNKHYSYIFPFTFYELFVFKNSNMRIVNGIIGFMS